MRQLCAIRENESPILQTKGASCRANRLFPNYRFVLLRRHVSVQRRTSLSW